MSSESTAPKTRPLPAFLTVALARLQAEIQQLGSAQLSLVAMFLRSEGIEGDWGLAPTLDHLVAAPAPEPAPLEPQEG